MADYAGILKRICIVEDYIRQLSLNKLPANAAEGQYLKWVNGKPVWADITGLPDPDPDPDPDTDFTARWGWRDNDNDLLEADILALQGSGTFPHNGVVTANFSGANGSPFYLFVAEPSAEPIKLKWYADALNNETIGEGLFEVKGTVGTWRIYGTTFQTDFSTPVEFRTSLT